MPFLKTSEYAAEKIYDGLVNKNSFEIHFPKSLTIILKDIKFLTKQNLFWIDWKTYKISKKKLIFNKNYS